MYNRENIQVTEGSTLSGLLEAATRLKSSLERAVYGGIQGAMEDQNEHIRVFLAVLDSVSVTTTPDPQE